jgi:hypothetical protein
MESVLGVAFYVFEVLALLTHQHILVTLTPMQPTATIIFQHLQAEHDALRSLSDTLLVHRHSVTVLQHTRIFDPCASRKAFRVDVPIVGIDSVRLPERTRHLTLNSPGGALSLGMEQSTRSARITDCETNVSHDRAQFSSGHICEVKRAIRTSATCSGCHFLEDREIRVQLAEANRKHSQLASEV